MIDQPEQLFHFAYQDNGAPRTLLLFHGTGGNENDLLSLVDPLKSRYNFLGLRGNVQENGMNRFFARMGQGLFDQDSIDREVEKLVMFIARWCQAKSITEQDLAFCGYSNGANMILATLFAHPTVIQKAVLFHPMLPSQPALTVSFQGRQLLVSYGEEDQMVPINESHRVINVLTARGATVEVVEHAGGHEVVRDEVDKALKFLETD